MPIVNSYETNLLWQRIIRWVFDAFADKAFKRSRFSLTTCGIFRMQYIRTFASCIWQRLWPKPNPLNHTTSWIGDCHTEDKAPSPTGPKQKIGRWMLFHGSRNLSIDRGANILHAPPHHSQRTSTWKSIGQRQGLQYKNYPRGRYGRSAALSKCERDEKFSGTEKTREC